VAIAVPVELLARGARPFSNFFGSAPRYAGPTERIVREPAGKQLIFLSTTPARRVDRRIALIVILLSLLVFLVVVPFARMQLATVWAFIPAYESALAINDLITATLLYVQFTIFRSPALLVLAVGYLFCTFIAIPHAVSFPGLLSPTGLLGAGSQTTAWLYIFWHAGFPLAVILYVWLGNRARATDTSIKLSAPIPTSIVFVAALVCILTLLATADGAMLPNVIQGNRDTPAAMIVLGTTWLLSIMALLLVGLRRPQTVLDLWLTVVMFAWIFDVALSAVFNGGRFDLGFYAGRLYGLVAASFVLIMLLLETSVLYARLARSMHTRSLGQATQLRAAESARDAAVNADRAKSRFVATVSHDLRQPLHAMNLFISALRRRVSGEEATRLVEGMATAASSMQGMFNSLLDVSKLDAGVIDPSFEDFPIEQVLTRLRTAFAGPAAHKGLALEIPAAKALVHSDPVLLESVLRNLVSNAIRYTKSGEVVVTCHTEGDVVELEVRDTGPGIPAEQHDAIFEEFRRLDSSNQTERGLGLGLAIVRRLAGLLDAGIGLQSEVGHGSTFTVRVPPAQWDDVIVGADAAEPATMVGRRLLLVDDDPLVRDALSAEIADWGAETIVAGTPEEVFAAIGVPGRPPPELAIIDRDLGSGLTGPALLEAVKQRFGLTIPAVIVTGATDADTLESLRQSGYPWITKPIDVGALRGIVYEMLPMRRR
jgi:two-component system, sensor histidine kinase and response regulator